MHRERIKFRYSGMSAHETKIKYKTNLWLYVSENP